MDIYVTSVCWVSLLQTLFEENVSLVLLNVSHKLNDEKWVSLTVSLDEY